MKLHSDWMKQGIFNCENSGYGKDPSDGDTDADGVVCDNNNKLDTFKCRLQFRWKRLFNVFAGADALTF